MWSFIIGPIGRYVIGALIIAALIGWGGCSIKGCVDAKHRAAILEKAAEKNKEVESADRKTEAEIRKMSDDELADFIRRGGMR
jgi:hypothetical protein